MSTTQAALVSLTQAAAGLPVREAGVPEEIPPDQARAGRDELPGRVESQ